MDRRTIPLDQRPIICRARPLGQYVHTRAPPITPEPKETKETKETKEKGKAKPKNHPEAKETPETITPETIRVDT